MQTSEYLLKVMSADSIRGGDGACVYIAEWWVNKYVWKG